MPSTQQQQQSTDNSLAMLWGILLAFAVIGFAWFFFHEWIAGTVLKWRLIEMRLIAWIIPSMDTRVKQLELWKPSQLHFADLAFISADVGRYLRFPISLVLLSFGLITYLNQVTLRFKRNYTMQTLAACEQQNWPQIAPVVPLNLVSTPIDSGPWAMALTPFQFAKQHQLLALKKIDSLKGSIAMVIKEPSLKVTLRRDVAQHTFTMQLGALWNGVDALHMPAKALFAVFAARGARDREASDQLLEMLSQSTQHLDTQGSLALRSSNNAYVDRILKKYQSHPLITTVTGQHAYVLGVMASMLVLARADGVLASAEFLWLKPQDRTLWFMLNCIGRQTAYTEVAGPFAHWICERAVGQKLRVPMVDMAVEALDAALREVRLPEDR